MRLACLECVRKHIGEALYHMEEAFMGYPQHAMWAVGAWGHAASEALRAFPELAMRLRADRLKFERCLARVLLGRPSLIILDEATNALDYESEMAFRKVIQSMSGNAAVVLIAHRLATVRMADRAAVLENGRIVRREK